MSRKRKRRKPTKRSKSVLETMRRAPRESVRSIVSLTLIVAVIIGWGIIRDKPINTAPEDADIIVYVSPRCSCHRPWIDDLRRDGLAVSVVPTRDIVKSQADLGVPREFSACHTAVASGYWLEGHVPAASVTALTSEAPENIAGIAHLRANVKTGERVDYEVVSYDARGQALSSWQQHQLTGESEIRVTHDRP